MPLSNAKLQYYDSNVLRLPADKRKEYHPVGRAKSPTPGRVKIPHLLTV